MTDIELQALLSPLPGDAPCGADTRFDAEYLALEEAAAGQPEREYGDTLIPAKGPDWRIVQESALLLAARSRDLRLAVWLTRSGARMGGVAQAMRGLQLVHGLLQNHWDRVHPQLDGQDATDRLNALSTLVHGDGGLADLRAARFSSQRGALGLRDIELVLGHVEPLPGEAVPSQQGLLAGLATACAEVPELIAQMRAGEQAVLGIDAVLSDKLPAAKGLELAPLKKLMQRVGEAAALYEAAASGAAPGADAQLAVALPGTAAAVAVPSGAIATRDDAIRGLQRICEWIERNEPSSPAPLFIRRSQQLLQMSFIDIVRDLLPDNVRQIEHFAGKSTS